MSKLRATSLPLQIINMLEYMCNNTYVNVLFNMVETDPWKIGNGTRQGGILSPLIFSFYIDNIISEVSNMVPGCSLGGVKTNIICYADDISILAPSVYGLQKLVDLLCMRFCQAGLSVNVEKSAYIVFKAKKSSSVNTTLTFRDEMFRRVAEFKYLGIVLSEDMCNTKDINRAINSFLKQFNSMFSKFNYLDDHLLHFLFKSYTSSFYGAETWLTSPYKKDLKKISVVYHKAVKRVARLNVWDSNHEACSIVKAPIFRHLIAKRSLCFFYSIIKSSSPCILPYRYFFRYESKFYVELKKLFFETYEVKDVFCNPLCSLLARIQFVQNNEPRRR